MRLVAVVALLSVPAWAATYYIDHTSGNDASAGTTVGTAWQHLPGMVGCASACAAKTPSAGDRFILKGGVVWENANFPVAWTWSGSADDGIYVGVDATWYTGESWSRPVFDASGVPISGTYNVFWRFVSSPQYVTLDNIEMRDFHWSTPSEWMKANYIVVGGADYISLLNLYLHKWTHSGTASDENMHVIVGASSAPFAEHSTCDRCTVENNDGDNDSGVGFYAFGSVTNSVIHDIVTAIVCGVGGSKTISGNVIYNIHQTFDGTHNHANAIETVGLGVVGTVYIHDNAIYSMDLGEGIMVGNDNETDYIWNNTIDATGGTASAGKLRQTSGVSPVAQYWWNNTMVPAPGTDCFISDSSITIGAVVLQNNHCISTGELTHQVMANSLTADHNLLQSPGAAASEGYTSAQTYRYSPTAPNNATVDGGTDLSANCTGYLSGLCSDSTYGSMRTARVRGATWDIGAYEYVPTGAIRVAGKARMSGRVQIQ